MPERELTCIICPNGCSLKVVTDDDARVVSIDGFKCRRGKEYAETEIVAPMRTLTALVKVDGGDLAMCPVRTTAGVPKDRVRELAQKALTLTVKAPVHIGDVIVSDFEKTGTDLIACRGVPVKK